MQREINTPSRWMPWALVLLCAPLVLLLIEVIRGAVNDTRLARTQTVQSAIDRLRLHAAVRAKELEVLLNQRAASQPALREAVTDSEIVGHWSRMAAAEQTPVYSALVDPHSVIVLHSDRGRVGKRLEGAWYDRQLPEYGGGVALVQESVLGGDRTVYDMSIPVETALGRAEYHEALDAAALHGEALQRQRTTLGSWLIVLGFTGAIEAAACWSLLTLARDNRQAFKKLQSKSQERAREMSQIGSGLAHEVRNPLHALRINLHTLRRVLGGRSALPPDQVAATIDESDAAIDRLDELMRDFLQYSDRNSGQKEPIDLVQEIQATVRLLSEDFRRAQTSVTEQVPGEALSIFIDPLRLRQALLNILTYAQHRAGKGGSINVTVRRQNKGAELTVQNSGPKLGEKQRKQLFEPFQAPAETGSGLGLALVQTFVEEVGGSVSCDSDGASKGLCRVWFPLEESLAKRVASR